jgi:KUP system potassium uptake protein
LGIPHIFANPEILAAINPMAMVNFVMRHDLRRLFLVLGSVMLSVTGGEAMYADLGHFGRDPIRKSWFFITYPALLVNYFGQGAYLLSGKEVVGENLFYSLVPSQLLVPMVILATLATVIASQALISGAFSLMTQAISLGLFPYLPVLHTNEHHHGQIYVPAVNWLLCVGSISLVLYFQSSTKMAGAYGLAVSGVMFLTTLGMIIIAREYWKWHIIRVLSLFIPLLLIDALFVVANSLKIIEGGYIPLTIAFLFMIIATTWQWGRAKVKKVFDYYPTMTVKELIETKEATTDLQTLPKTVIVMTPTSIKTVNDPIPTLKQIFWDRYGVLPKHLIFLTVKTLKEPRTDHRYRVTKLYEDPKKGSITAVSLCFGFMEDPNVENALEGLAAHKEVNVDTDHRTWLIHAMEERILVGKLSWWNAFRFTLYQFIYNNAETAVEYLGLGKDIPLTLESVPVTISANKHLRVRLELVTEEE